MHPLTFLITIMIVSIVFQRISHGIHNFMMEERFDKGNKQSIIVMIDASNADFRSILYTIRSLTNNAWCLKRCSIGLRHSNPNLVNQRLQHAGVNIVVRCCEEYEDLGSLYNGERFICYVKPDTTFTHNWDLLAIDDVENIYMSGGHIQNSILTCHVSGPDQIPRLIPSRDFSRVSISSMSLSRQSKIPVPSILINSNFLFFGKGAMETLSQTKWGANDDILISATLFSNGFKFYLPSTSIVFSPIQTDWMGQISIQKKMNHKQLNHYLMIFMDHYGIRNASEVSDRTYYTILGMVDSDNMNEVYAKYGTRHTLEQSKNRIRQKMVIT